MRNLLISTSFAIGLSGLLAGCGVSSTNSLLYNGIGSEIQRPDTITRAVSADKYFRLMCQRAALGGNGGRSCRQLRLEQTEWRRLVYSSLNDIDERCDRYVEALDAARKDKDLLDKQLRQVANTTTAIVELTEPRTSAAITILNEAFSLAEASSTNYFSRMLLTLENGTVYGVVKKQQIAYRESLSESYIEKVSSKPTAYFAIRGYLRLCLPSTIESEINAAITDVQYNDNSRQIIGSVNPDLAALAAVPKTPTDANELVDRWKNPGGRGGNGNGGGVKEPPKPQEPLAKGRIPNTDEKNMTEKVARQLQNRLCVERTGDLGAVNPLSITRAALRYFESTYNEPGKQKEVNEDGIFNQGMIQELMKTKPCTELDQRGVGPKNTFEKFEYYEDNGQPNSRLEALQKNLNLIVTRAMTNDKLRKQFPKVAALFPKSAAAPAMSKSKTAPAANGAGTKTSKKNGQKANEKVVIPPLINAANKSSGSIGSSAGLTNKFDARTRRNIGNIFKIAETFTKLKKRLQPVAGKPRDQMSVELNVVLGTLRQIFCNKKFGAC